jgi:putative hydrolase of the HAD superfamily
VTAIPWDRIDTLFLDAGGTLITMDFPRIAREMAELGVTCDPAALMRAEAAARPVVSRKFATLKSTERPDWFATVVDVVLQRATELDAYDRADLVTALVPRIRFPGRSLELWNTPLPGVAEALAQLKAAGLRLVVVSNADGTVEEGLTRAGLRAHLDDVIDSHLVGFEKPDPRIFHEALRRGSSDPACTLHVGDIYAADVLGARAAGVHALMLDPHGDWGELDCAVAPSVGDLVAKFRKRGRG